MLTSVATVTLMQYIPMVPRWRCGRSKFWWSRGPGRGWTMLVPWPFPNQSKQMPDMLHLFSRIVGRGGCAHGRLDHGSQKNPGRLCRQLAHLSILGLRQRMNNNLLEQLNCSPPDKCCPLPVHMQLVDLNGLFQVSVAQRNETFPRAALIWNLAASRVFSPGDESDAHAAAAAN